MGSEYTYRRQGDLKTLMISINLYNIFIICIKYK